MTEYNSANTKFYVGTAGQTASFKEIYGLVEVPELGATPEKIDVTNLSDSNKRYVFGIGDFGDLEFKFFYNKETTADSESADIIKNNYSYLRGLEKAGSKHTFKVSYPDGSGHTFEGSCTVRRDAVSVNGALSFTLAIALSSDISDLAE